ncbi:MYB transcription factor [Quillaja saponaria]|uniref:MYB transcription factor n=1 Tax=Quillaja saponaria TaxID=32244 RepID=A0AAD7L035_QUISA|nr:MYB transcription factor [Quillaja saponaria]
MATRTRRKFRVYRSRRRCSLRWFNYLSPCLKRGTYSEEEEVIIVKIYEILGNRWAMIAAHLPGSTVQGIKKHWEFNRTQLTMRTDSH